MSEASSARVVGPSETTKAETNSRTEIIVIEESENEEEEDTCTNPSNREKQNAEAAEIPSEHRTNVKTLCDMFPHATDTLTFMFLKMNGFDINQTISSLLEQQQAPGVFPSLSPNTLHTTTKTNRAPTAGDVKGIAQPSEAKTPQKFHAGKCFWKEDETNEDDFIVVVPKNEPDNPQRDRSHKLSSEWHQCYNGTAREYFVDPDFPPTTQSLDGRKRKADAEYSTAPSSAIQCFCGMPAAPRQVQSEGPNYGRFYLCCGKKAAGRKRRRPPLPREQDRAPRNDTTNTTNNESSSEATTSNATDQTRNPYKKKTSTSTQSPQSPPSRINAAECNFFRWDPDGSIGAEANSGGYSSTRFNLLSWQHFGLENGCCLFQKHIDPSQVRQGAVGNCWFLSALAVVAEKPYLVRQLLPHDCLNEKGCYQINLCLDGKWTPILVDSNLPVVISDSGKAKATTPRSARWGDGVQFELCRNTLTAFPAFCATPNRQLWPSLVEKAYAKVHGSYQQLSGGFISEGLHDLTGAPFETIIFSGNILDHEELWARLLSFQEAGFLMGVATSRGGDGLVGGHAYSLLQVVEIPDAIIGQQCKVTDFFGQPHGKNPSKSYATTHGSRSKVRLVRIRNPWGTREWKGAWSANSEKWTKALRQLLGSSTYAKGDGTFFMSFEDMLQRFHHMDVGKTIEGWVHASTEGQFENVGEPLCSCKLVFRMNVEQKTYCYVSIIQPKKRSNTGTSYWYTDPSMIILRRQRHAYADEWFCEASVLAGVKRMSYCELFLDPNYDYVCLPFSTMATKNKGKMQVPFRLCTYSAVGIKTCVIQNEESLRRAAVLAVHRELLRVEHKLLYPIANHGTLVCSHGEGCLYFVCINGESEKYLSLKLNLEAPQGILIGPQGHETSVDVPPRSQRVIATAAGNGKFSAATGMNFRYICSEVRSYGKAALLSSQPRSSKLMDATALSLSGDLLVGSIDSFRISDRGSDTIDTYMWIPQIGSSC